MNKKRFQVWQHLNMRLKTMCLNGWRMFHQHVFRLVLFSLLSGSAALAYAEETWPVVFEAEHRAVLSAEREGVLISFPVDTGHRVKKGDTLARLDTGELALQKKRHEYNRKFLSTQLENIERLNKRGLATDEEVAKSRMEFGVTKTDIEILRRQISHSYIRAPFSGVVVQRLAQPYEWVESGKPVVELVDTERLRIVGNLSSALAVRLAIGTEHQFFVKDLNAHVTGKVKAVTPSVDEQSNTVRVVWTLTKRVPGVLAGMQGDLKL